jgi:hypothetical protein
MNHSNMGFDDVAPSGIPLRTGDYHYSQDRIRDFWHLKKWIGRIVRLFINSATGLLSGGAVTAGSIPATQVSIALGSTASLLSVQKPGAAWGTPPATLMEDIEHVFDFTALADQAVNAGGVWNATLDGTTVNYLKVAYAETDGPTRSRAKAVGTYAYERVPSFVFSCSSVAPTDYEALLAKITGNGTTALVIVPNRPLLNSRLAKLITGSDFLLPNTQYIIDGTPYQGAYSLSLPEAVTGDVIDIQVRAACKIVQSDTEHVMSWFQSLFTTKGTAGLVRLFPGDRAKLTYRGAGFCLQAPVKIANPATLPTEAGYGPSWSPDGRFLAVAHGTSSPYVTIYDWISGTPVKIANPATLPTGTGYGSSWSPDGRFLAVAHDASPYVTIYDWISGTPVKIANPATLPAGNGRGSSWSPDGRFLAVAHLTTPFITIYDWISGAPVKIANPATLPADNGYGSSWSPDGRFLAVAHDASPYVTIYDNRLAAAKEWMIDIASRGLERIGFRSILGYRFK